MAPAMIGDGDPWFVVVLSKSCRWWQWPMAPVVAGGGGPWLMVMVHGWCWRSLAVAVIGGRGPSLALVFGSSCS